MIDFIVNIMIGGLLGLFGGLLGIGGGLFAIPTLSLLYGMDQQLAQGTALAMVVPNIVLGIYNTINAIKLTGKLRLCWAAAPLFCHGLAH